MIEPAIADWILHVDLDQFQASVETQRRPELRGQPLIVGGEGDPTRARQVVTCASYEARAFGVRAGMPMRAAAKKCPQAIFLPLDAPAYEQASEEVMTTLRAMSALVEVWGWDEAFVGVRTDDPERLAADIQDAIRSAAGLPSSVGIGDNKLRAKVATGFGKPAGIFRLTVENWMPVMGDRPVQALWGVGSKGAARFAEHGISTVAELADADPAELASWWGPTIGPRYRQLARGEGDTHIRVEPWVARSRSRQTTFPQDLTERVDISREVADLARAITKEVVDDGRQVAKVAVIVRNSSFYTESHITTLAAPTVDSADVERAALAILDRFPLVRPVRLLGVRVELTSTG
jgi:DNA polymerase-4